MVFGIDSGDLRLAALLVVLAYAVFLVAYLLDRRREGAQRIRVAARTAVQHVLLTLPAGHYLQTAGFTPTGLAILLALAGVSVVLNRILPREEEPVNPYAEPLPMMLSKLDSAPFSSREYQPGISPFT